MQTEIAGDGALMCLEQGITFEPPSGDDTGLLPGELSVGLGNS